MSSHIPAPKLKGFAKKKKKKKKTKAQIKKMKRRQ